MNYNASNPLIPHASTSLIRDDFKMQSLINSLARRMIRKEIKSLQGKKKTFTIQGEWIDIR